MKKKPAMICALLAALLLMIGMTGCGEQKEQTLSGGYTSQSLLNQMNYTFDEEKNVTVRFLAGGYSVYAQTGTYEISADGAIITFSFPTGEEEANAYLPGEMSSLGGAFSFRQEEDRIWIGTVCYQKDVVGTEPGEIICLRMRHAETRPKGSAVMCFPPEEQKPRLPLSVRFFWQNFPTHGTDAFPPARRSILYFHPGG